MRAAAASLLSLLSLLSAPPPARGDELVLARGQLEAALTVETNLSKRLAGKPWSLAPDLWLGVTADLTVGVVHSARALSLVDSGLGLCVAGAEQGCGRVYDGVALDAKWAIVRRGGGRGGGVGVAARLRLVQASFDPWKPSLRAGALVVAGTPVLGGRLRLRLIADPQLQLGLVNRDLGNRARLRLPLWLGVELPAARAGLWLRTGVDGELATFGDTYAVPLGLELAFAPRADLSFLLFAGFAAPLGPQNQLGARHGGLAASWRY